MNKKSHKSEQSISKKDITLLSASHRQNKAPWGEKGS